MEKSKVAEDIKIFLQKHSKNRKTVQILDQDYQFQFIEINYDSIVVSEESLNDLGDGQWQFTFECKHDREANGLVTTVEALIQANAFYQEVEKNYFLIEGITLDNIKDKN